MPIIQPILPLADGKTEETCDQLLPVNIHTLLTLAKLVQTIQSQAQEEQQDVPHSPTDPPAEQPAESATSPQPAISMEPAQAKAAKATRSSAGAMADGRPARDERGGGA